MANYKRGRCRTQSITFTSGGHWLRHWPRWGDIIFHTRPRRRAETRTARAIMIGRLDPDEAIWPMGNHKPHHYFW